MLDILVNSQYNDPYMALSHFEIKLPFQMHQELVKLKFVTGIDMSEHIRRAIDEYLIRNPARAERPFQKLV